MSDLSIVKEWVKDAQAVVGFSGAGISTESGIPDFRSPGGVWSQNRTVMFQGFIESREEREEYWRQKRAIWPEMAKAQPNKGHETFVRLHKMGKLTGMITQNIERLHQKSGLPDDKVIELHGTMTHAECLSCGNAISMNEACKRIDAGDLAPQCESCDGLLKPATVSFGQSLREDDLYKASAWSRESDVFISVGSSLVVQPAAGFPALAKRHRAKLIIVNRDPTPLDEIADAVFHEEIGEILPAFL